MNKKQALPAAYIVGAQKAGTTTLYDWLSQHPEIYGNPASKDFPFFSEQSLFERGVDELARFFQNVDHRKMNLGGDASLSYSPGAIKRLHSMIPQVKILFIVRNPVERCFSSWRYATERHLEKRDFPQAIDEEIKGIGYNGNWEARQKDYLKHGLYAEQLSEMLAYFSKSHVKVVLYEEMVSSPDKILSEIFSFLGVDGNFKPILSVKNKTRGGSKYPFLSKLIYRDRSQITLFSGLLRKLTSASLRRNIREFLVNINRQQTTRIYMNDITRQLLSGYYATDQIRLKKLSGIDFSVWTTPTDSEQK